MSYAPADFQDLSYWIGRQIEWSGGELQAEYLEIRPLADEIDGSPGGLLIPDHRIRFGDLYELTFRMLAGADLSWRSYGFHLRQLDGEDIWRFDRHPLEASGPPVDHLHVVPDMDVHWEWDEMWLDEVLDWVHRYQTSQDLPRPTVRIR